MLYESLSGAESQHHEVSRRSRYKLIIDSTEDDSIMRLLGATDVVDLSRKSLFKLSQMPEEQELERLHLVSGVKFSAIQGRLAVLSQTEPVNESFYDLFNQNFKAVRGRDGDVSFFANIAVGGISRRSRINEGFSCVVHIRESQLGLVPAPFLNRFEKYRLDTGTIMDAGWMPLGGLGRLVKKAREIVNHKIVHTMGESGLFGLVPTQTLDSVFIGLLPAGALAESGDPTQFLDCYSTLLHCLGAFVSKFTSLKVSDEAIDDALSIAMELLPTESAAVLCDMVSIETFNSKRVI